VPGTRDFVTLTLNTDQPGLTGIGITFFGGPLTPALRQTVDLLAAAIVGDDPLRIEAIGDKLRNAAGGTAGPGGMFTLALAAIDIALWDIKGKALGVPVSTLAGGHRTSVPT
jgi:L-alanine-DL-glutamate epimerase-like enolase superfamily enzyme